jgi:hypothetical protein
LKRRDQPMPRRTQERLHEIDEIEEAVDRLVEALRDFLLLLIRRMRSGGRP